MDVRTLRVPGRMNWSNNISTSIWESPSLRGLHSQGEKRSTSMTGLTYVWVGGSAGSLQAGDIAPLNLRTKNLSAQPYCGSSGMHNNAINSLASFKMQTEHLKPVRSMSRVIQSVRTDPTYRGMTRSIPVVTDELTPKEDTCQARVWASVFNTRQEPSFVGFSYCDSA